MASQPFKNRARACKNMMRTIISDLRRGQLYNAAQTPPGQSLGRKASYIQIARDDLQRLDLFKPVQLLRTPRNQLHLLQLWTQAISYISTHLHLRNTHTYTPFPERYCSSCLPLQILGNETHTILRCPHSSLLTQLTIHSLMLNHRRFDHCAWAAYTDTQKVAMLLGSIPSKLDRQHEKGWVLPILLTCTQLIYSNSLSPYPTPYPPPYLHPRHYLVLASTRWYSLSSMSESVWRT